MLLCLGGPLHNALRPPQEGMEKMRLKNIQTGKKYEIVNSGKDVYIDGQPAIINGQITSFFEECDNPLNDIVKKDRMAIKDELLFADIDDMYKWEREEILKFVKSIGAEQYVITKRANVNIIRQLRNLKEELEKQTFVEVDNDR